PRYLRPAPGGVGDRSLRPPWPGRGDAAGGQHDRGTGDAAAGERSHYRQRLSIVACRPAGPHPARATADSQGAIWAEAPAQMPASSHPARAPGRQPVALPRLRTMSGPDRGLTFRNSRNTTVHILITGSSGQIGTNL